MLIFEHGNETYLAILVHHTQYTIVFQSMNCDCFFEGMLMLTQRSSKAKFSFLNSNSPIAGKFNHTQPM